MTKATCFAMLLSASFLAPFALGRRVAFVPHKGFQHTAKQMATSNEAKSARSLSSFPQPEVAGVEEEEEQGLRMRREDLKRQLLAKADEFKRLQEGMDRDLQRKGEENADEITGQEEKSGFVFRLIKRIVKKIVRQKKDKDMARKRRDHKMRKILGSDAFGTLTLEVGELGNATIALAEELSKLNPSSTPTFGWKGYADGDPSDCKLGGKWKLRFTTAADATFQENPRHGKITTSQDVDPVAGTLTNIVDFERGKVEGFRVIVSGEAVSADEIDLSFRRVVIRRKSRFPRLFGKVSIPIPTRLLKSVNRYLSGGKSGTRGPYFQLKYLDDDLRMHKTGEGNWFIQSRLDDSGVEPVC